MARGSRSVRRLLAQAEEQPPGFARTALIEKAVREADLDGDLDLAYEARMALASAAEHGGEPQKALVAITWCLGQIDAHPGRFDVHDAYWTMKWLPFSLLEVPDVPLAEVERVVEEVARRYRAEGTGEDALAKLAWSVPLSTGHVQEAVEGHRHWRLLPRTEYADCRACDASAEVDLALAVGEPRRALDIARPVLAGRLECAEQPQNVLSELIAPLVELGEVEEAERLHQWGLRLSRGNPSLTGALSAHLSHLVRTSRLDEAAELLVELLHVVDHGLFDADARMQVQAAGASLAAALVEGGVERFPGDVGGRPSATTALAEQLAKAARETADAFDRRNGTDARRREVDAVLAVRPVLPAPTAGGPPSPPPRPPELAAAPTDSAPPAEDGDDEDPAELLRRVHDDHALDLEAALVLSERAADGFRSAGDAEGLARARWGTASVLLRLGRDDEAVQLLEQVFSELAGQPDERVVVALQLARAVHDPTSPDGAERAEHWRRQAEREAGQTGQPEQDLRQCRLLAVDWAVMRAEPDDVEAAAAPYADLRAEIGADDAEELVDVWIGEALARGTAGDDDGAVRAVEAAWELALVAQDDRALLGTAELRAAVLETAGRLPELVEALQLVQDVGQRLGDRAGAAEAAQARADLLLDLDLPQDGLRAAFEAVDLLAGSGRRRELAWARLTVGHGFRETGADQSAFDIWSEVVEQAAEDGDRLLETVVAQEIARLDLEHDFLDDALTGARRALDAAQDGEPLYRARALRLLATVHAAREELPDALAAGEQCLQVLGDVDDVDVHAALVAAAHASHADRLVLAGQGARALGRYEGARAGGAGALGAAALAPLLVAEVDLGRVDALHALGRDAEAVALAEQVVAAGRVEQEPALVADALWAVARYAEPDAARFDAAIEAYAQAGAPDEQLADLRAQRDDALRPRRSRRRR